MAGNARAYNATYTGSHLDRVAFPLGGLGAGMVCLEGTGALSHVSLRGQPEIFNEPLMFSALCVQGSGGKMARGGRVARVLEGPVPSWKVLFPWGKQFGGAGQGSCGKSYGLPRFAQASFKARFPFGRVSLHDAGMPVSVELTGWSPFLPGQADDSSLPVAGLEYTFSNDTARPIEAVYSFHARNCLHDPSLDHLPPERRPAHGVRPAGQGFILYQEAAPEQPWTQGALLAATDATGARPCPATYRDRVGSETGQMQGAAGESWVGAGRCGREGPGGQLRAGMLLCRACGQGDAPALVCRPFRECRGGG